MRRPTPLPRPRPFPYPPPAPSAINGAGATDPATALAAPSPSPLGPIKGEPELPNPSHLSSAPTRPRSIAATKRSPELRPRRSIRFTGAYSSHPSPW
jgi:hypothetical protein